MNTYIIYQEPSKPHYPLLIYRPNQDWRDPHYFIPPFPVADVFMHQQMDK